MVYAGITANNAVQLFKDFSAAMPDGKLYGPDGIAESGFADPKEGGIPADVGAKVKVSIAVLPPDEYGAEGQRFFEDYAAEYGDKSPDPYAIYGFESMSLTLDAIKRAAAEGKVDKQAVIDQLFATKDRSSVARHLLDRRERRHDAHRLRLVPHRQGQARLRRDRQGQDGCP